MKPITTIKKTAYLLAALSLLASLLPLPLIGRIGSVFAESETPAPESTPAGNGETAQPPAGEQPAAEAEETVGQPDEEPLFEEMEMEFSLLAAMEGPDPAGQSGSTRQKLPPAPGNDTTKYNNGLCNSNKDLCASAENVTKKMENQWVQEFELSSGESIIVINVKGGGTDDWQFFEKGAGNVCPQGAMYCVEFTENNRVKITGNDCELKGGGKNQTLECHGPNQIDFWKFTETDDQGGDTGDGEPNDDVCEWDASLMASDPNCVDPNNGGGEEPNDDVCEWDASLMASDPNCVDPNNGGGEEPNDDVCEWDASLMANDPNCFDPNGDGEDDAGQIIVDPENPGGGTGSGGGAGGAAAAGFIPVTAPDAAADEVVLIPVTGADLSVQWQSGLFNLGLLLLGGALALEGVSRRKQVE